MAGLFEEEPRCLRAAGKQRDLRPDLAAEPHRGPEAVEVGEHRAGCLNGVCDIGDTRREPAQNAVDLTHDFELGDAEFVVEGHHLMRLDEEGRTRPGVSMYDAGEVAPLSCTDGYHKAVVALGIELVLEDPLILGRTEDAFKPLDDGFAEPADIAAQRPKRRRGMVGDLAVGVEAGLDGLRHLGMADKLRRPARERGQR